MTDPMVAVIGDANVDLLVRLPTMDKPDLVPTLTGGGTGANTAVALAKLGVPTAFLGSVGEDPFGRHVIADLIGHGVDAAGVRFFPDRYTVCVFAFIDAEGERHLWGWPRERPSFTVLSPDTAADAAEATWVHTTGMILTSEATTFPVLEEALRRARERGAVTSIDLNLRAEKEPGPDFLARVSRLLEHCTFVLGSGPEEFALFGAGDWRQNARMMVRPERTIIARDGAAGAVRFAEDDEHEYPAFPVRVVDTVGAGDAFNAGFIACKHVGGDDDEAMRWANAVAALAVSSDGARNTPDLATLATFLHSSHPLRT